MYACALSIHENFLDVAGFCGRVRPNHPGVPRHLRGRHPHQRHGRQEGHPDFHTQANKRPRINTQTLNIQYYIYVQQDNLQHAYKHQS